MRNMRLGILNTKKYKQNTLDILKKFRSNQEWTLAYQQKIVQRKAINESAVLQATVEAKEAQSKPNEATVKEKEAQNKPNEAIAKEKEALEAQKKRDEATVATSATSSAPRRETQPPNVRREKLPVKRKKGSTAYKTMSMEERINSFIIRMNGEIKESKVQKLDQLKQIFFPVSVYKHYYILCINHFNGTIDIIDNRKLPQNMKKKEKYKDFPQLMFKAYVAFLKPYGYDGDEIEKYKDK